MADEPMIDLQSDHYFMGEAPVRSSVAVAHEALFIRTAQNLYCVRNPGRREP